MTILLPRLRSVDVDAMIDGLGAEQALTPYRDRFAPLPDRVWFAATATGGRVATTRELIELRRAVLDVAERQGFPDRAARQATAEFDAEAAALLGEWPLLTSSDALRDDTWAFMAVVLLPDVCHWRFGAEPARYRGGVRNTLQRLWMRARALDRGENHEARWGLLDALTEDALVQITERPGISANPVLARSLGEAWVRAAARFGKGAMQVLMREATLRFRLLNEIRALASLPAEELDALTEDLFARAALNANLGGRSQA